MSAQHSQSTASTVKIVIALIAIALAVAIIVILWTRGSNSSGTVQTEVRQMKAGARSKGR
ncbi:MAG: hypothetical protein JST51_07125 [Armatimonadetes bacterium]|nr:hypothetical protein [Armatimonadota bacterium]